MFRRVNSSPASPTITAAAREPRSAAWSWLSSDSPRTRPGVVAGHHVDGLGAEVASRVSGRGDAARRSTRRDDHAAFANWPDSEARLKSE